jgi:hypothetical protein
MRLRIAKPSDSRAIAGIHFASRDKFGLGFFAQVSKLFLVHYYRVVLDDPNSVVVCAEEDDGTICGFASATLDANMQFANIRKHKVRLGLALLPSIMMKPRVLLDALSRYRSTKANGDSKFVSVSGVRGEYWVWSARGNNAIWAGVLNNTHLHVLKILGAKNLRFEVDANNLSVVRFSERNGAELLSRVVLSDGRERLIMNYDLEKKFGRKSGFRRGI